MRVVFDPNVLVSALITPAGVAQRVVQAGIEGRFEFAMCPKLVVELENVSRRPKIARLIPEGAVDQFVADVRGGADMQPDHEVQPLSRDPNDDYLIALAAAFGADHLVTGDADLLDLPHAPVTITALRDFAELLGHPPPD